MNISILVPALDVNSLKKCLFFLKENSHYNHQILVFLNNVNKSSNEYIEISKMLSNNFDEFFIMNSASNLGISLSLKYLVAKSKYDWLLYLNDDEYVLKNWDLELETYIKKQDNTYNKFFTLRRIEHPSKNKDNFYFSGLSISLEDNDGNINGDELSDIEKYKNISLGNPSYRKASVPFFIEKRTYLMLGGYDENYYPGAGTDPDLLCSFIEKYGIDNVIMADTSLVYHTSKRRATDNNSVISYIRPKSDEQAIFYEKHGMSMREFDNLLFDFNKEFSVKQLIDVSFQLFNIVQDRDEITWLVNKVKEINPKNILEIGTERGGSLFLWNRISDKSGKKISIDMCDDNTKKFRETTFKFVGDYDQIHFLNGNSRSDEIYNKVLSILNGEKLDYLFIDGDHSYDGVKHDFEKYSPLVKDGGLIGFHDIIESDENKRTNTLVYKFWQELDREKRREMIKQGKEIFGVGVYKK